MSRTKGTAFAVSWLLVGVLTGCAGTQGVSPGGGDEVVAFAAGEPITMAQLEEASSDELERMDQERYDLFRRTLDAMAVERMIENEAASRGLTREELVLAEVDARLTQPTEDHIQTFWETNKHRAREGMTLADSRDQIIATLKMEIREELETQFVQTMRRKVELEVLIEAPRYEVTLTEFARARGVEGAPITFVEFGDFQCPYCRRAHPVVERLLVEFGDDIRYVFQDYPLEKHVNARQASEAARCADDQGLFWDYFQHLMVMQGNLSDADLVKRAAESGLDVDAFTACYDSKMHSTGVDKAFDNGKAMNLGGTPTFFINGRMVRGAKPYEQLKLVVEEELARVREDSNVGG
jgi:predicted DsbA family dithiol-disulfide isomerase